MSEPDFGPQPPVSTLRADWDKQEMFSEPSSTRPGCNLIHLLQRRCQSSGGEKPRRTCHELISKYHDCGSGPEGLEQSMKETTGEECSSSASEGWESRRGEGSQAPLSSSMASSLEDFQEYAERLKLKAAGISEHRKAIFNDHYAPRFTPQPDMQAPVYDPWYTRLFHRPAQCSPGRQRPWEKFKKDYKEV